MKTLKKYLEKQYANVKEIKMGYHTGTGATVIDCKGNRRRVYNGKIGH